MLSNFSIYHNIHILYTICINICTLAATPHILIIEWIYLFYMFMYNLENGKKKM